MRQQGVHELADGGSDRVLRRSAQEGVVTRGGPDGLEGGLGGAAWWFWL